METTHPVLCNPKRAFRRIAGFTLVELLVVVGIIAVLVSLLLPALNKARQSSQLISCCSNLRQIAMGFSLYAHDNREFWPVRITGTAGSYSRPAHACEGYTLEYYLSKYLGKELRDYGTNAGNTTVIGRLFICPASDIVAASTTGTNKIYISPNYPSHGFGANCYTGLYYHYQGDNSDLFVNPTSNSLPSWRPGFFKGWQTQVPVQYCCRNRETGVSAPTGLDGVCRESFHFPGGRPTAFIDGHVTVLNNKYYKVNYQAIMSSNWRTPATDFPPLKNIHAWFQNSEIGAQGTAAFGGGNRFALSEY